MGSFLLSPPLFLRATMVQGVQNATWFRRWAIRVMAGCKLCPSISQEEVCVWLHPGPRGMNLHQPHASITAGKKPACWRGATTTKNWGTCSCASCLWPRWMLSKISAKKQHPAVLLCPPDPQPSPSLSCQWQFPWKGSWGAGDFLMLTNVVHCRYNLLLKVIMAILDTFSWTIIHEQWAFLQKCEFNNPKALLIYPSKLIQRII